MNGQCALGASLGGHGPLFATSLLADVDDRVPAALLIGLAILGVLTAVVLFISSWRRRRDLVRIRIREQWLVTMLRSIGDGVIATDAAGRITFMNSVAQELTGWKEREAEHKPLVKVFQTFDRKERKPTENPIDIVVRECRAITAIEPVLLVARDGAERTVLSCASPIRGENESVAGVVFVFRDVTQRELAESALQASQEMFRLITNYISELVAVLDLEGRFLYASQSHATLLAPPRELYLRSCFDAVHPDDRQRIRGLFAQTVRTGCENRAPFRLLAAGGQILPMDSIITPIRDEQGKVDKVLAVSRDISARQHAEERVRHEMEFSDTLINSMPGIFYLYEGATRKILRWNKNLETVTGYSAEEFETLDPLTYFPDDEKPVVHERMLKCFAEGSTDIEVNLLAKDGRRTPFYVTGFRLEIDGRPCMLGIGIDITARLAGEEALRANVRLQEIDRLKSEFLATMSHELRTPLNSIIGFTGILRQGLAGPMNDEQKKQLGMVHSSARHLLGLINDLLDLSRIESGKMELFAEDFAVTDLIGEIAQSLAPQVQQKHLRFETSIDQPDLRMRTDRKKCFQILLNLANNAVKFTEAGRVAVKVSSTPDTIQFDVTDTGIGIKDENLSHLFEAFRQVDGSARRVYEGTGLGLYLSKQLAKMLGGTITVESEFGMGSRFTLVLPQNPP
jgi:PAS domain S-box-containing protein